jgi:hypothetical protein
MNNIIRSLDDETLKRVKGDFGFLVARIAKEEGELDLRLRNNYFNLYYKGNSLARVEVARTPYRIEINKAFAVGSIDDNRFGLPEMSGDYCAYSVEAKKLPAFLSKAVITKLYSKIKDCAFSEELVFEQLLMADNRNRKDFIVIDRQVQGGALGRNRVDLLGLRHTGDANEYNFVIIEAKMGNNPELRREVADQLQHYVQIMNEHFGDFQRCYQRTYLQMKQLGLLDTPSFDEISIVAPVKGVVVVAGYPGLARKATQELNQGYQDLSIKTISYKL